MHSLISILNTKQVNNKDHKTFDFTKFIILVDFRVNHSKILLIKYIF